jgi:hypothetical protein
MLTLITGWLREVGKLIRFPNVGTFSTAEDFIEVDRISPSEYGYRVEHSEIKRLMKRLRRFETVEFTDAYGVLLSEATIDQRYGKDGGIDCVIRIVARTERGASIAATRLRNIIISGDY